MNLNDREEEIISQFYDHATTPTATYMRKIVKQHLREACEEAVREECEKWACTCPKKETAAQRNEREKVHAYYDKPGGCLCEQVGESVFKISHDCPKHGPHANRPTAADALKAVVKLLSMIRSGKAFSVSPMEAGAPSFVVGCDDLISGRRDTPAARAITGESPINSFKTTEGK